MAGLFKTPKTSITPPVDPADTANRAANVRLKRLDQGGTATTILGSAMASSPQLGGPRSTLTGLG